VLLSFGPVRNAQYAPLAGQVSRMLDGDKPQSTTVEQPTPFELVISLLNGPPCGPSRFRSRCLAGHPKSFDELPPVAT
jgi:hypothetical protein